MLHRLQFDNDQPVHDEIETLSAKRPFAVEHGDAELPLIGQALPFKFDAHRILIDSLVETRAQGLVHTYGAANRSSDNRLALRRKHRCHTYEH